MKKYFTTILLSAFLLSSCNKYLELKPKNQVVVETMEDARLMMAAYLSSITAPSNLTTTFNGKAMTWPFNRDAVANFAFYSDDLNMTTAMANSYGKKYQPDYYEDGDWKGLTFSNTMWSRLYTHMGYLNVVINATDKFKGEPNYEMVRGEALTIRAYFIFKLLQLYAPYHKIELGVPLNLDPEIIDGGDRLPQDKVYSQIIGDLKAALALNGSDAKWNIFFSKNIIHALLAQVYSFKAESAAKENDDWKNAEEHSAVILEQYSLETTGAELKSTFAPAAPGPFKNLPHALLVLGYNITPKSNLYSLFGSGDQALFASDELKNSFEPTDIRLAAHFNSYGRIEKYAYTFTTADFSVLFRVADLYLINTEAKIRLKQAKGKQQLEAFKLNRTGITTNIADADLLNELLNERRKEFFVENEIRWMDMKRFGIKVTRKATDPKLNVDVDYTLESDDYRYALPIPLESEVTYNKIIQQNPVW